MADLRDDSILFSLKGLMDVEKERIDKERAERAERVREAQIALAMQAERERVRREAEVKKALNLAEAARLEAQRRREEDARLEALKRTAVEAARIEVEARGRLEMMEQKLAHERRMLELREAPRRKRATRLAILGFSLAFATVAGAASFYYGTLRPDAERLRVAYAELVSAERGRADEAKRLLDRSNKRGDQLEAELRGARDEIDELKRAATAAGGDTKTEKRSVRPATFRSEASPSRKKRCNDDGDPLNGCLK